LVSPETPFQTVIGGTSPGGEVSAMAFLLCICRSFGKITFRPVARWRWSLASCAAEAALLQAFFLSGWLPFDYFFSS
jgi:hypothetical protein